MSELLVSALPLADQAEIQLRESNRTIASVRALLAAFEPPAEPASPSCPAPSRPAGGSIPFSTAEHIAMMQRQCTDHPPLQVCHPGHLPKMFEVTGNLKTQFQVECGACGVRTARWHSQEAAATAWANRDVMQIVQVAPAQAVA